MRIAVLGVGLIGGSIGLAARRRLEAEVAGFDPDSPNIERALELGALDRGAGSVAEAVEGAEVAFCAAPVRALPDLVAEAIAASGPDTAVTDVGSTKRELVVGLAAADGAERFVGGHPLAGAETAGVENARPDLLEGARWYLTPTERTSGIHFDRVQRAIADLGARPAAIEASAHDRMMATISHLPHVVANALASTAAATLGEGSERLPEVGPSFRDATRVAGANPAIWTDIFATNREGLAAEIAAISARLAEAAELIREGDRSSVDSWHRSAGDDRRALLEAGSAGGTLRELRMTVSNEPGTVAEIALALGRERVNIEDMALYPAADMRTGAISIWVAGSGEAERAAEIVRGLGHSVSLVSGPE
jgi:prephenate dehydrogenase